MKASENFVNVRGVNKREPLGQRGETNLQLLNFQRPRKRVYIVFIAELSPAEAYK